MQFESNHEEMLDTFKLRNVLQNNCLALFKNVNFKQKTEELFQTKGDKRKGHDN